MLSHFKKKQFFSFKIIPRIIILFLSLLYLNAQAQTAADHPRILTKPTYKTKFQESLDKTSWKKEYIETLKKSVEEYLILTKKNPDWLVSRLQMNWKTKHTKVFLNAGDFSHSEGKAPVPTVRYAGSRDWASDYDSPQLEEVLPFSDDPRGVYLTNRNSGKKEWASPAKTGSIIEGINNRIMTIVQNAALLYWLTGEEKYAKLAEPVFTTYIQGMYYREAPIDLKNTGQNEISGLATFEVIHEKIVVPLTLTYDFMYEYLHKKDQSKTIAVFQKWGDQIIKFGVPDNNWNLFQANFLTYIAIVLEDNDQYQNGKGQQYFLDHIFETSTERQIAIKESVLVYDQTTGIWPESPSYSVHVTTTLLNILTLLDNLTDKNELNNYPIIEKANLAAFQYLFPSGYTAGFGDSGHKLLPSENFELLIANYRKYNSREKEELISSILQESITKNQYKRKAHGLFELFFYVDELNPLFNGGTAILADSKLITSTFYAPNVSMFNQRIGNGDDATMVSTVGSFGNHSHVNGISIELYANKYVLGPDMGRGPSYWHKDHRQWYNQFPAHNTVTVNGASTYGAMRGFLPYTLDNHFPKSGETDPKFKKITYSKVSFVEPKTNANQQRLTAIIQPEMGKPYILDIFRSEVPDAAPQKHEYFYHNLGQKLQIFSKQSEIKLSPTEELNSKNGALPAYDYLKEKQSTTLSVDFEGLFTLSSKNQANNLMKLWVKGYENQTVFSVMSPTSNALSSGTAPKEVLEKPVPTMVVRRNSAAWKDPFVVVFNPYLDDKANSIAKVEYPKDFSTTGSQSIQVTFNDQKYQDHIVANESENHITNQKQFYQKGLLSVVRKDTITQKPLFIFVSGMYQFKQENWGMLSLDKAATMSAEATDFGYFIQTDTPVTVQFPKNITNKTPYIEIYKNNELIDRRKGMINRSNDQQVEFRIPYASDDVRIIL